MEFQDSVLGYNYLQKEFPRLVDSIDNLTATTQKLTAAINANGAAERIYNAAKKNAGGAEGTADGAITEEKVLSVISDMLETYSPGKKISPDNPLIDMGSRLLGISKTEVFARLAKQRQK